MSGKKGGPSSHTPSPGGVPSTSLSLPTANTARRHLDSKKKSENKQIHPGYSMFDWNKVCNSGVDLAGTKGQLLRVTPEELAMHCTDKDLWTAVRGVVYNVTEFARYHPGGRAQLMRGAGTDCTELFDKIHVWVSSESILQKCVVGYLVGFSPPKKPSTLNVSVSKPPFSEDRQGSLGTDVLTLHVPGPGGMDIGDVGGSNQGGNMEEDSRLTDNEEDEVTIPLPGISFQSTDISTPVPGISVPDISVPIPDISVPVPDISIPSYGDMTDISVPISRNYMISIPTKSYITNHPLISKTAYETEV